MAGLIHFLHERPDFGLGKLPHRIPEHDFLFGQYGQWLGGGGYILHRVGSIIGVEN
jgi:hypothetical protein